MMQSHPTYKIKPGDTLQSLTNLFGIEQSMWLKYHNNVWTSQYIEKEITPQITEIFLFPWLWDKAGALNDTPASEYQITPTAIEKLPETKPALRHIGLGWEYDLAMKPYYEPLHYGVVLALFNGDRVNTIKYETSIRRLEREDGYHYIEIDRISETAVNDESPDLVFEILAVKAASALYPLVLTVTEQDGIVGVRNLPDIQKRWETVKREIKKYYSGDTLEKYLRLNEKALQNEETLLGGLRNDWFLHACFNKIYQTYGKKYAFTNRIAAPFIFDTDGVAYTVRQTIDPVIDEQGLVKIEMKGEYSDERSIADLESGLNYALYDSAGKPEGTYYAQYLIESEHHTIDALMIDSSLQLTAGSKKVFIVISRINRQKT